MLNIDVDRMLKSLEKENFHLLDDERLCQLAIEVRTALIVLRDEQAALPGAAEAVELFESYDKVLGAELETIFFMGKRPYRHPTRIAHKIRVAGIAGIGQNDLVARLSVWNGGNVNHHLVHTNTAQNRSGLPMQGANTLV